MKQTKLSHEPVVLCRQWVEKQWIMLCVIVLEQFVQQKFAFQL